MEILTRVSRRSRQAPRGCRRPRAPSTLPATLLAIALGWIIETSVARAEISVATEYQVKAVFLVNFAKYADWPAEVFAAADSPIVIAVLGETRLTDEIQKAIAGRTVNGRSIVLKRLAPGAESSVCHILFISAREQQRAPNLLATLKPGVLTVGESDDFLERGGIINLARRDQRVALEVNLAAAGQARIKLSSKLLSVAEVKGKAR